MASWPGWAPLIDKRRNYGTKIFLRAHFVHNCFNQFSCRLAWRILMSALSSCESEFLIFSGNRRRFGGQPGWSKTPGQRNWQDHSSDIKALLADLASWRTTGALPLPNPRRLIAHQTPRAGSVLFRRVKIPNPLLARAPDTYTAFKADVHETAISSLAVAFGVKKKL